MEDEISGVLWSHQRHRLHCHRISRFLVGGAGWERIDGVNCMQPDMDYALLATSDRTEETPVPMSTSHLISGARPTRIRQHLTVLLVSVLALVGIGLIRFATNAGIASLAQQQSNVEAVIDEYMVAMAAGDVQQAYALFSPRAKRQMTVTGIEQLMRGDAYMAFQGVSECNCREPPDSYRH